MIGASNRDIFLNLILMERERQNKKFPNEERQKQVSLHQWNTILTEELGEFAKEVNDHRDVEAVIELAETAAVCLKIAEIYFGPEALTQAFIRMAERTTNQKAKE